MTLNEGFLVVTMCQKCAQLHLALTISSQYFASMKQRDILDGIQRTRIDIKAVIAPLHREATHVTVVVTAGHVTAWVVIADRIGEGGNAIACVRLSVCTSVRLFPLCLRNQLTVGLELLRVSRS